MADCTFWHDLAEEFKSLDQGQALSIGWQYTSGEPGHYTYHLDGGTDLFRLRFKRLAQKAVLMLHERDNRDSFEVWCDMLRKSDRDPRNEGPLVREKLGDGTYITHQKGRIPKASEASAHLCIVLEMQQVETQRHPAVDVVPTATSQEVTDPPTVPISDGSVDAEPGAVSERTRPGPKPNLQRSRQVKAIVWEICEGKGLRKNLDTICEALDEAGVPFPKTWKTRDLPIRSWADAAALEPDLPKKVIEHHLEVAQN